MALTLEELETRNPKTETLLSSHHEYFNRRQRRYQMRMVPVAKRQKENHLHSGDQPLFFKR
jgi:hypothetical protein